MLFLEIIFTSLIFLEKFLSFGSFQNYTFGGTKSQPRTVMRYGAQELAGWVEYLTHSLDAMSY